MAEAKNKSKTPVGNISAKLTNDDLKKPKGQWKTKADNLIKFEQCPNLTHEAAKNTEFRTRPEGLKQKLNNLHLLNSWVRNKAVWSSSAKPMSL